MHQFITQLGEEFKLIAHELLGLELPTIHLLFLSFIAFIALSLTKRLYDWYAFRCIKDPNKRHMHIKTVHYILGLLYLIYLAKNWLPGESGLAAYFGILSAGLAIAFQDILASLAGWVFIAIRKPFVVGNRIEIGKHIGDVIDIRLFEFSLMEVGNWVDADQSTGRIIHIPNGFIFKNTVANYNQGFNYVWNEVPVTITFESNWKHAEELLSSIANEESEQASKNAARQIKEAENKYMINFKYLTPIVWTSVADNGITLTIRYLCEPRKRRYSEGKIWQKILTAFAAAEQVDLAYPTWRIFHNPQEGKPPHIPPTR